MKSLRTLAGALRAACAAASLLAAAGCYSDRFTGHFNDLPDIDEDADAVLEETGQDPETIARNEARLREIASEAEPIYKMNAGDVIEIRVYDHEDIGIKTRIGPDGMVGIAFMDQVKLSGLTIAEGAARIREGLAPYIKNPVVSVTVHEIESETATIAGACAHPGIYGISNSTRLADLYAKAGSSAERLFNGVDIDVADLEHSIIMRDGEILPVDFIKAINLGDPLHNIHLKTGDYVFIAQRMESSITVCGDVQRPHKRLFENGMGLIETLAAAGWMAETHWKHVIIIRDGLANPRLYKVDVDGIMAGKRSNVALRAGDIVYVPKDNLSEYNVFVRKLMPTAQLINLLVSRVTAIAN